MLRHRSLSDREKITLLFQEIVEGVRNKDASRILPHFSTHYSDSWGITYWDIKRNIRQELSRFSLFEIAIEDLNLQISPPYAEAKGTVGLLLQTFEMSTPLFFRLALNVYLEKEGKNWKITRIEGYDDIVRQIYGLEF